jgi:hypothetical protein
LAILGFGIAAFLAQGNRLDVMITSALPAFLNVRYGVCALLDSEHFSSEEFFSSSKKFVGAVTAFTRIFLLNIIIMQKRLRLST